MCTSSLHGCYTHPSRPAPMKTANANNLFLDNRNLNVRRMLFSPYNPSRLGCEKNKKTGTDSQNDTIDRMRMHITPDQVQIHKQSLNELVSTVTPR